MISPQHRIAASLHDISMDCPELASGSGFRMTTIETEPARMPDNKIKEPTPAHHGHLTNDSYSKHPTAADPDFARPSHRDHTSNEPLPR